LDRFSASLTSLHIAGTAVDMNIDSQGTIQIKNKAGQLESIGATHAGAINTHLHAVGPSRGVRKLASNPLHC